MNYQLLDALMQKDVVKLGDFVLKSGLKSPIYIDLRPLISTPNILSLAADALVNLIKGSNADYDYIVGVPYAALPVATLVCEKLNKPMLMKRKEVKAYGTKKLIEGIYKRGGKCLIVEDVVTSGMSIQETVDALEKEGLVCRDVFAVLDRQQGGSEKLLKNKIILKTCVNMDNILEYLINKGTIDNKRRDDIKRMLDNPEKHVEDKEVVSWDISKRSSLFKNPLNKKIFDYMLMKKSNLCVAVDYTKTKDIMHIVDLIKDDIICLKLHCDIIEDFTLEFIHDLSKIAETHNFIIFEDRKFADTGNTVELQLSKGLYHISEWANLVTVHSVSGDSILKTVKKVMDSNGSKLKGSLIIAELSTKGALTNDDNYIEKTKKMAIDNSDSVSGFITQKRCLDDPSFLYWTPGVNLNATSDGAGQQWRSIDKAIIDDGNDIIIVGRAITNAGPDENIKKEVKRYKECGWNAFHNKQ
ncbi:Uridine 5'-monophosphate synthase [Strongyloides ratti]|uniref:Uridine 5'-monophosphate synthase n=1 Tax=Strongyloides ratti TaxID=34506 RepID=A0A090L4D0_STRRB|nr:Uridine 5'-monophosphate synthase [Strongyloides ratti]CEF62977.1 Uridine 5'-monophosphate synthase [Strongyloides ratti]